MTFKVPEASCNKYFIAAGSKASFRYELKVENNQFFDAVLKLLTPHVIFRWNTSIKNIFHNKEDNTASCMTSVIAGIEAYYVGAQDGCTTTIRAGFASNVINIIAPSSKTVSCELNFKNIPGDSPGFYAGGFKHAKNKSHGQFRGKKRK